MSPRAERIFRAWELTCYGAFFVSVPVAKVLSKRGSDRALPLMLVALGAMGIFFLFRFFIYANPEQIWDRRLKETALPREKKTAVTIGYVMCGVLLGFGGIGLFDREMMDRAISTVSPMRFFL